MSDLIDREEAIKRLKMYGAEHNAIAVINGCPSAEPEQKTGKWINTYRNGFGNLIGYCNKCGRSASVDNYCPNCGANMRGKEDVCMD